MYTIDLDTAPQFPKEFGYLKVVEHRKGGQFDWNPSRLSLFVPREQEREMITGAQLDARGVLKNRPVANFNMLKYLLEHQDLVPAAFGDNNIFAWGTICEDTRNGRLTVPFMFQERGVWKPYIRWLVTHWGPSDPALLVS